MSVCLNMIVKNESAIIRSTLENLTKYVTFSYWVISDTGSTDGTQDIIRNFFKERNIHGELHEDKWENFGHNRTLALQYAYKKSDYVLIFDADDAFNGDFKLPKLNPTRNGEKNTIDKLGCKFGSGGSDFTWYRPVILNNNLKWKYFGVLHEYVDCIEPNYSPVSANIDGNYFINARTIGGDRNKDDKKYYKDAILLEKALEEEQDTGLKARYAFYCAQSFRDYNDLHNAIKYYKLRTTMGYFDEEIFVSYYNAGRLMILANQRKDAAKVAAEKENKENGTKDSSPTYTEDEIVKTLLDGWKFMKDRSESLYELALYYRNKNEFAKGYMYAKLGVKIPFPSHRLLFIQGDIYHWRMYDELAINGFYIQKHQDCIRYNRKMLRIRNDKRLMDNLMFSINSILKDVTSPTERKFTLCNNRLLGLTLILNFKENTEFCNILMNSLMRYMKDIYKIERFIITFPESKKNEVEQWRNNYPYFEMISYKHPTHLLSNLKSKFNRNDRYIFFIQESWIAFARKNYFHHSLTLLNSNKQHGQFVFNRNDTDIDKYLDPTTGVTQLADPKNGNTDNQKYLLHSKFKTPAKSPVIFRREFFDAMTSLDNPVDEDFVTLFQNQKDFCVIRKQ